MKKAKTGAGKKGESAVDPSLEALRARIDAIDSELIELLDQRAATASVIGDEKRRLWREAELSGRPAAAPGFYDPEREQRIFRRLLDHKARRRGAGGKSPFPDPAVAHVFREIISGCRALEETMRIAFLGPAGTFSQTAARQIFGSSVEYLESPTIAEVFEAVFRRQADSGVVPFENSAEGGVLETLEQLLRTDLMVRGEHVLKIDHYLLSKATNLSSVRRVHSHPAALAQCAQWLARNLAGVAAIPATSTSAAARAAADDPSSAAIASQAAAGIFGLSILKERIQDQAENVTRFITLAFGDGPVTGDDRTSLILSLKDDRDLGRALAIFAAGRIEVTRVESRASAARSWHYHYFLDFPGHRRSPEVARVLKKVSSLCERLKMLGSYPRFRGGS